MFVTAKNLLDIYNNKKNMSKKHVKIVRSATLFCDTFKKILNFQQPTTVLNQTICYQNLFHHKL